MNSSCSFVVADGNRDAAGWSCRAWQRCANARAAPAPSRSFSQRRTPVAPQLAANGRRRMREHAGDRPRALAQQRHDELLAPKPN